MATVKADHCTFCLQDYFLFFLTCELNGTENDMFANKKFQEEKRSRLANGNEANPFPLQLSVLLISIQWMRLRCLLYDYAKCSIWIEFNFGPKIKPFLSRKSESKATHGSCVILFWVSVTQRCFTRLDNPCFTFSWQEFRKLPVTSRFWVSKNKKTKIRKYKILSRTEWNIKF